MRILVSMVSALIAFSPAANAQVQGEYRPALSAMSVHEISQLLTANEGAVGYLKIDDGQNSPMKTMKLVARKIYGEGGENNVFFIDGYHAQEAMSYYQYFGVPRGLVGSFMATDLETFVIEHQKSGGLIVVTDADVGYTRFIDRVHEFIVQKWMKRDAFANIHGKAVAVDADTSNFTFIFASDKPFEIKPASKDHPKGLNSAELGAVSMANLKNSQMGFTLVHREELEAQLKGCAGTLGQ